MTYRPILPKFVRDAVRMTGEAATIPGDVQGLDAAHGEPTRLEFGAWYNGEPPAEPELDDDFWDAVDQDVSWWRAASTQSAATGRQEPS